MNLDFGVARLRPAVSAGSFAVGGSDALVLGGSVFESDNPGKISLEQPALKLLGASEVGSSLFCRNRSRPLYACDLHRLNYTPGQGGWYGCSVSSTQDTFEGRNSMALGMDDPK